MPRKKSSDPNSSVTGFRTAHGNARDHGRLTANECPPADELPEAIGSTPVAPDRNTNGQFVKGNKAQKRQLARVKPGGVLDRVDANADPAWKAARRWGQRAAGHRISEMAAAHGGHLSSGVCRLLRSAARLSADAEYLSRRAAADNDPNLLRTAAQLDAGSRPAERDAWALAALEANARAKSDKGADIIAVIKSLGSKPGSSPDDSGDDK